MRPAKRASKGRTKVVRSRSELCGSAEAKRAAAVVLEGLSGLRSPVEAARALGVSPPRYYALELKGLQGLIASMEPSPRGRQRGPERLLADALGERDRLRRELARAQALLRSAQRAMGILPAVEGAKGRMGKADGKPRRRRRPAVRAKKAVSVLRARAGNEEQGGAEPASPVPVRPQGVPAREH